MAPPSDPLDQFQVGTPTDTIAKDFKKAMRSEQRHPEDILDSFRDTFTESLIDNFPHPIRTLMRNFLREQGVQLDQRFPSTTSLKDILHITPICAPRVAVRAQCRTGSPAPGLSSHTDLLANIAHGIGGISSKLSALEDKVNKIDG